MKALLDIDTIRFYDLDEWLWDWFDYDDAVVNEILDFLYSLKGEQKDKLDKLLGYHGGNKVAVMIYHAYCDGELSAISSLLEQDDDHLLYWKK